MRLMFFQHHERSVIRAAIDDEQFKQLTRLAKHRFNRALEFYGAAKTRNHDCEWRRRVAFFEPPKHHATASLHMPRSFFPCSAANAFSFASATSSRAGFGPGSICGQCPPIKAAS